MTFPIITAYTAAILALLQAILMFRVAGGRTQAKVLIGDGGDDTLLRKIRRHGNLAENAAMGLILIFLLEATAIDRIFIIGLAGIFVFARLAHAVGMTRSSGVTAGRFVGALGTMLTLVGGSGLLIWQLLGATMPV